MPINWTEAMDASLRKAYEAGSSYAECAAVINVEFGLGITRNACIGRGSRLGLNGNVPRPTRTSPPKRPVVQRERQRYSPESRRMMTIVEGAPVVAISRPDLDAMSLRLSVVDLDKLTCRWPAGGEDGNPITFCGCAPASGLVYCAPHARIAYPALALSDEERALNRVRGQRVARERSRDRMVLA
jgi:GcrA cell cycle regulator